MGHLRQIKSIGLRNLRLQKFGLVAALGAFVLAALAAPQADAQVSGGFRPLPGAGSHGGPGPVGDRRGPGRARPPRHSQDVVTVQVNQNYYGFSSLDLTQALSYELGGRPIMSVTVRMASQSGRGQATLLEDGVPNERSQTVAQYLGDYTFQIYRPHSQPRLELRMNGQVFVQSVTARVAGFVPPPPYPPPHDPYDPYPNDPYNPNPYPGYGDVISVPLNQYFQGQNLIDLDSLLSLQYHQGRHIKRVIVRGRSDAGRGQVAVVVNGMRQGAHLMLGTYSTDASFVVNGAVGYQVRSLDLEIIGRVTIENVSVELQ